MTAPTSRTLPAITELRRLPSPVPTPQALAWHDGALWIGSRDTRRLCRVDAGNWTVLEETAAPGTPWSAVSAFGALYLVTGEDADDDRYVRRFEPGQGFDASYRIALPEFTGSYLSFDGQGLYVSQWYKHLVLQLDRDGGVVRTINAGAEICGHVFTGGQLYVLRGTEGNGESWQVGRLDLREETPQVTDLAQVPFACRSLTFDGTHFWTNHRSADETVSFSLPV